MARRCAALFAFALGAASSSAFYIPGSFPNAFTATSALRVKVNSLTSAQTELPYEYYRAPFCQPADGAQRISENLGELIAGDRIETSPYAFAMRVDTRDAPVVLCQTRLGEDDAATLRKRIEQGYRAHMLLDALPVTNYELLGDGGRGQVLTGFPMGYTTARANESAHEHGHQGHSHEELDVFLYNHLEFKVLVHKADSASLLPPRRTAALPPPEAWLVVGFEVLPCSVDRGAMSGLPPYNSSRDRVAPDSGAAPLLASRLACDGARPAWVRPGEIVAFTHSVRFVEAPAIPWVNRWDGYLDASGVDQELQLFSLLNSLLVVLALGALIALYILRAVRRDLLAYHSACDAEQDAVPGDAGGWKLICNDVFRAPPHADWLAVAVGSDAQVLMVAFSTASLASLGFMSPSARGALLSAVILLYLLSIGVGGYAAVRCLACLHASSGVLPLPNWRAVSLRTAALLPGAAAVVLALINISVRAAGDAAGAVPASLFLSLFSIWCFASVPLCVVGGYVASHAQLPAVPEGCKPTHIPRSVVPSTPEEQEALFLRRAPSSAWVALAGGVLPFGALFIQVHFVFAALWRHQTYYAFGFLTAALALAAALTAESAVVITYLSLAGEEWRWPWRAFLAGASGALYVGAYALCYALAGPLNLVGAAAVTMYGLYSALLTVAVGVAGGAIGVAASHAFVRLLYSSLKSD